MSDGTACVSKPFLHEQRRQISSSREVVSLQTMQSYRQVVKVYFKRSVSRLGSNYFA